MRTFIERVALILFGLIVAVLIGCSLSRAADLPKKAITPKAAPVLAYNPFAIGISAGMALSPTENVLTLNGTVQGDGPLKGLPLGPLAGIVASYDLIPIGPAFVRATAEVHYDFSRGCIGDACQLERKNGFLLQQGLELGLTAAQGNGLLPTSGQPANWPLSINVPSDLATNTKIGLRGGMAERWVGLCGVIDTSGTFACGNQTLWAPYAGVGLGFMASTNSEIRVVYDHIFWKQGNSFSTVAAASLIDSSTFVAATIKQEDDVKFQWLYHF